MRVRMTSNGVVTTAVIVPEIAPTMRFSNAVSSTASDERPSGMEFEDDLKYRA